MRKFLKTFLLSAVILLISISFFGQTRYRIGFQIPGVNAGETFVMRVNLPPGEPYFGEPLFLDITSSAVVYTGAIYPAGISIFYMLESGPRSCTFGGNAYGVLVIPARDTIINVDCNAPTSAFTLAGTYSGPPGSSIVLKSRYNEELTITASANGTAGFKFPKQYGGSDVYGLYIKTAPAGCNCAITPNAEGMMPLDSSGLKVICNTAVELASRSSDNKVFNTFYETATPVIGGMGVNEGRYIAFVSSGVGLDGSSGKYRQIFWRDMKTGITKMISRGTDGSEGNNSSYAPAISADGKSVAFESYASNLSAGDNNGVRDVYLWKEGAGISWISRGGNGESFEPRINGNGSSIAFSSSSSTLSSGVEGTSTVNVYLFNGSIQLLTRDPNTGKGLGGYAPDISEDGNSVVFCSFSDKLVMDDKNGLWDIFLWQNGGLKRISKTSTGGEREQGTESASRIVQASISGNGKFVVFATTAGNMVSYDNNKVQDVFITDVSTGRVSRLSLNNDAVEGNGDSPIEQGGRIGISYDGKWICFQTNADNMGVPKGNIVMKNFVTGETKPVTNSVYNTTGRPLMSRYGVYVVAGCSEKFDTRFPSSGIFRFFTGK